MPKCIDKVFFFAVPVRHQKSIKRSEDLFWYSMQGIFYLGIVGLCFLNTAATIFKIDPLQQILELFNLTDKYYILLRILRQMFISTCLFEMVKGATMLVNYGLAYFRITYNCVEMLRILSKNVFRISESI